MKSKVLILAGGKSDRFWPLSDKVLFPFLGKPLIRQQIEKIKKAGLEDLIVVCNNENLPVIKKLGVKIVLQKGEGQGAAILSAEKSLRNQSLLIINANDIFEDSLLKEVKRLANNPRVQALLTGFVTPSYFPGGYLIVKNETSPPMEGRSFLGRFGFFLASFIPAYGGAGYSEARNKLIKGIIEKPSKGKEPSNLVRLVVDYFRDVNLLFYYLKKIKKKSDKAYELAMSDMIKDGIKFNLLKYDGALGYLKYPWHTLEVMNYFLRRIKRPKVSKSLQIAKSASIKRQVILEEGVKVFENAKIVGPTFIGKDTIVGNNTIIRQSMIGKNCVIGFSTEVTRSYLGENCWFHSNYVGDSVLDKNVSLGTGAVLANLRLDEGNISSVVEGEKIDTKRQKLGAIIGKNVRIGVNASLMPGVKVGKNSFIGAGVVLDKDLGESKFCLQKQNLRVRGNIKRIKEGRGRFKEKISY